MVAYGYAIAFLLRLASSLPWKRTQNRLLSAKIALVLLPLPRFFLQKFHFAPHRLSTNWIASSKFFNRPNLDLQVYVRARSIQLMATPVCPARVSRGFCSSAALDRWFRLRFVTLVFCFIMASAAPMHVILQLVIVKPVTNRRNRLFRGSNILVVATSFPGLRASPGQISQYVLICPISSGRLRRRCPCSDRLPILE
jgi:hypothetical protein